MCMFVSIWCLRVQWFDIFWFQQNDKEWKKQEKCNKKSLEIKFNKHKRMSLHRADLLLLLSFQVML